MSKSNWKVSTNYNTKKHVDVAVCVSVGVGESLRVGVSLCQCCVISYAGFKSREQ